MGNADVKALGPQARIVPGGGLCNNSRRTSQPALNGTWNSSTKVSGAPYLARSVPRFPAAKLLSLPLNFTLLIDPDPGSK
jgi:hypothetical protein